MTTSCKSPSHRQYREALEGARIQSYLIRADLGDAMKRGETPGETIDWSHELEGARDRATYGIDQLRAAERALNAHFDRGCANVREGLARVEAGL